MGNPPVWSMSFRSATLNPLLPECQAAAHDSDFQYVWMSEKL
jgi:hypothetical protein